MNDNTTTWKVGFADGTLASGFIARENITLGLSEIPGQVFGEACLLCGSCLRLTCRPDQLYQPHLAKPADLWDLGIGVPTSVGALTRAFSSQSYRSSHRVGNLFTALADCFYLCQSFIHFVQLAIPPPATRVSRHHPSHPLPRVWPRTLTSACKRLLALDVVSQADFDPSIQLVLRVIDLGRGVQPLHLGPTGI